MLTKEKQMKDARIKTKQRKTINPPRFSLLLHGRHERRCREEKQLLPPALSASARHQSCQSSVRTPVQQGPTV